jgi:hypothetical protein
MERQFHFFIAGLSAAEPVGRKGALCWATTRDRDRAPHDSPPLRGSAGQLAVQPARILSATRSSRPPAVVIVGFDGTIRWIDVHPGYAPRTEVAQILAVLDELDSQPCAAPAGRSQAVHKLRICAHS